MYKSADETVYVCTNRYTVCSIRMLSEIGKPLRQIGMPLRQIGKLLRQIGKPLRKIYEIFATSWIKLNIDSCVSPSLHYNDKFQ